MVLVYGAFSNHAAICGESLMTCDRVKPPDPNPGAYAASARFVALTVCGPTSPSATTLMDLSFVRLLSPRSAF